MQMIENKYLGKNQHRFIVEGNNLFELQMEAQKLAFNSVKACGLCGGESLYLRAYIAQKKYKYVKLCCANPDCRASVTFGNKIEEPDVYYLRKNEDHTLQWEKYIPDQKQKDEPI